MKSLVCLGFVLAASAAQADPYTSTVSPDKQSVTTTGNGISATATRQGANGPITITITRTPSSGYNPMGAGGYDPMGH